MFNLKRKSFRPLLGLLLLGLSGCATQEYKMPAPTQQKAISVNVSKADSEGWSDGFLGLHRIPNSQVVVGCQQGSGAAVVLLGAVGAAANAVAGGSASARLIQGKEAELGIYIDSQIASAVEKTIKAKNLEARFSRGGEGGNATLSITPAVVLCALSDTDIQPFVIFKVELLGSDGGLPIWKTRYVGSTGGPRPVSGPGSWSDGNGTLLKSVVQQSIDQLVRVMLTDISTPYKRDEASLILVEGQYPYRRPRMRAFGYKLSEDEQYIAFLPRAGDRSPFYGVHVLEKSFFNIRPAHVGKDGVLVGDDAASSETSSPASK